MNGDALNDSIDDTGKTASAAWQIDGTMASRIAAKISPAVSSMDAKWIDAIRAKGVEVRWV